MYQMVETTNAGVPAFLMKLWSLVEDESSDDLISWDSSGTSFHLYDQNRFSKEILPLYFKHSNIASFIRQLNMYGFRKVVHLTSRIKYEKDDLEFQHPYFQRDQESLLEYIKRKPVQTKVSEESSKISNNDDFNKLFQNVKNIASKQEIISNKFDSIKRENENLWREVANLRQKNLRQQQILNKIIQFLVAAVGKQQMSSATSVKRKVPMITDADEDVKPKYMRYSNNENVKTEDSHNCDGFTIEELHSPEEELDIIPIVTVQDLEPDLPSNSNETSIVKSPIKKQNIDDRKASNNINDNDVSQGVDSMQSDLDILKELLSTPNFTLDQNQIQNFFSSDMPFTFSLSSDANNMNDNSNVATNDDNQLITYSTPLSFNDLENIFENDAIKDEKTEFNTLQTPIIDSPNTPNFPTQDID